LPIFGLTRDSPHTICGVEVAINMECLEKERKKLLSCCFCTLEGKCPHLADYRGCSHSHWRIPKNDAAQRLLFEVCLLRDILCSGSAMQHLKPQTTQV